MRQYVITAAAAVGLIALWAAILPPTAEPATKQAAARSRTIARALLLCRSQNASDQACAAALAKELRSDGNVHVSTQVSGPPCQGDQEVPANVDRCD